MILSDQDLKNELEWGGLEVEPLDKNDIQPASIDLHLGNSFSSLRPQSSNEEGGIPIIKVWNPPKTHKFSQYDDMPILLLRHEFMLGITKERIRIPDYLVGRVEGKSSLGRLGLLIHATAGYVDPGWDGCLTLELHNISGYPIQIVPGMPIAQLSVMQMTAAADRPYGSEGLGSKYSGNPDSPEPSRFKLDLGVANA